MGLCFIADQLSQLWLLCVYLFSLAYSVITFHKAMFAGELLKAMLIAIKIWSSSFFCAGDPELAGSFFENSF